MQSVFDSPTVKSAESLHKTLSILSVLMWAVLNGFCGYYYFTQTKPEQRAFTAFVCVTTIWTLLDLDFASKLFHKVADLKAREKAGEEVSHLVSEFKAFYDQGYKCKYYTGFLFCFLIGISTPPMLKQAFEGQIPWSDVAEYMLFLAFLGTISGMVVMSLNYPFIIHTVSYTVSGMIVPVITFINYRQNRRIQNWQPVVKRVPVWVPASKNLMY